MHRAPSHTAPEAPAGTAASMTDLQDRLGAILIRQVENFRRLADVIDTERDALRRASVADLAETAERKRLLMELGTRLDQERVKVVDAICRRDGAEIDGGAARLEQIIRSVDDPTRRAALVQLHGDLREIVARVQTQGRLVVSAAQALTRHVTGLMQSVHGAIGQATVYGRRGRMDGGGARHAVDLRS